MMRIAAIALCFAALSGVASSVASAANYGPIGQNRLNPALLADRIQMGRRAERFNVANVPGYLQQQKAFILHSGGNASNIQRYLRDVNGSGSRF